MSDLNNPADVAAVLANPNTPAAELAQIVRQHPEFGAQVAGHPNVYPALLDWLAQYGNDASRAAAQQALQDMAAPPDVTVLRAPAAAPFVPMASAPVAVPMTVAPVVTPMAAAPGVTAPVAAAPMAVQPLVSQPLVEPLVTPAVDSAVAQTEQAAPAAEVPVDPVPVVVEPVTPAPSPVTPATTSFAPATSSPTAPATLGAGIASGARGAAAELKDIWKGDPKDKTGSWLERVGIVGGVLKYIIIAVVVVVVAIFGLRACSASAAAKSVTCSQFNSMSSSQQTSTLKALLSAHGDTTDESNVELAYLKVQTGCMMVSPSTKIDSVVSW